MIVWTLKEADPTACLRLGAQRIMREGGASERVKARDCCECVAERASARTQTHTQCLQPSRPHQGNLAAVATLSAGTSGWLPALASGPRLVSAATGPRTRPLLSLLLPSVRQGCVRL